VIPLARANYGFEKRQRELAHQKKKEEKKLRKLEAKKGLPAERPEEPATETKAE